MPRKREVPGALSLRRAASGALFCTLWVGIIAGSAWGYDVASGSKGNTIHVTVDDRADLTAGAKIAAEVLESPAWIVVQESTLRKDRLVDLAIRLDVAEVPVGTRGRLKVRMTGTDTAGKISFDQSHYISLVTKERVEAQQQSFEINECCLAAQAVQDPGIPPASFTLAGAIPNPFSSVTNLVFGLPSPGGSVQLQVFDLEGRQVRSIETPQLNGGFHRITWDGRSDAGIDVSPGTYFCRLSSGTWSATTKTQFVR